ncbi:MAG: hypothetical protein AB7Y46_11430 [Armatimonadota bacterium]
MERDLTQADRPADPPAEPQPGRKRSGCLRRLGMALLIVFVALAIPWTYFNITLGLKLERELQAIRDRGEPLTLEQAAPAMPPDSENAALIYNKIFRLEDWAFTGAIQNPEPDPTPSLLSEVPAEFTQARDRPEQVSDPDAILRRAMQDPTLQHVFGLLEEASERPKCVFDIPWQDGPETLFPHMAMFRECARWLAARVRLLAEDGDVAEAARWLRVGLRVSDHIRQDPTIIGLLVSYAVDAVMLVAAQESLSRLDIQRQDAEGLVAASGTSAIPPAFVQTVIFERAWNYDVFDWLARGENREASADLFGENFWSHVLLRLYVSPIGLPLRRYDRLTYLRIMQEEIEVLAQPYRSIPRPLRERGLQFADKYPLALLATRIEPDMIRLAAKRDYAIARVDQLHTALALNLYRQAHGGYPETLAPLTEVVDWPIRDDIFSGEPFRYRREGAGYVLWSLGPDLDDDGGHDYREEGRSWDDSDIVWRVEG